MRAEPGETGGSGRARPRPAALGAAGCAAQRRSHAADRSGSRARRARARRPRGARSAVRSADGTHPARRDVRRRRRRRRWCSRTAGPRMLTYWTYLIREMSERGPAGRRLRPARATARASRPPSGDYSIDAVRRGPRGRARGVPCPTAGGRWSSATRSARCRSPRGPEHHDVERRVGAARADQHRRRRSDRRAAAGAGARGRPGAQPDRSRSTASSAAGRRCRGSRPR